ncbi:MAG: AraC family transcriptional regulator [Hyphomonadaceae bacterium]|nr:AraC family transcriptional regulator [Hyphomonadaceae bacterium]
MVGLGLSIASGVQTTRLIGAGVASLHSLLDQLPTVPFYAKDRMLHFTNVNAAMVALCGVPRASLKGRGASEFFAEESSDAMTAVELEVMSTGRAARSRMVHVAPLHAAPVWLLLNCWPIVEDDGEVAGVAAVGHALPNSNRKDHGYRRVAEAAAFVTQKLSSPIRVRDLAQRAGVSISRFERDFIGVFGVPPNKYVAMVRLEAAMDMLRGTGDPIAEIAHACGYADQSAFTRRFQAATAMTPSEYRRSSIREAARR